MAFWCCDPCSHRIRQDLWHGDSQGRLLCCHRPRVCLQAQRPRHRASWASSLASRVELCWQLTFSSDPVLLWFTCCSYYLHNHNCYLHDRESRGQRARDASSQLTHPDHLRAPLERRRPPCPPHSTPGRVPSARLAARPAVPLRVIREPRCRMPHFPTAGDDMPSRVLRLRLHAADGRRGQGDSPARTPRCSSLGPSPHP